MDNAPRAPTDGREVAALVNHLFATRLAPNGRVPLRTQPVASSLGSGSQAALGTGGGQAR